MHISSEDRPYARRVIATFISAIRGVYFEKRRFLTEHMFPYSWSVARCNYYAFGPKVT